MVCHQVVTRQLWQSLLITDTFPLLLLPQRIFGEFVTVEMSFHAKALEVYTLAYQSIQSVDEEEDLEVGWGSAEG